jgi:hypothetical protein
MEARMKKEQNGGGAGPIFSAVFDNFVFNQLFALNGFIYTQGLVN